MKHFLAAVIFTLFGGVAQAAECISIDKLLSQVEGSKMQWVFEPPSVRFFAEIFASLPPAGPTPQSSGALLVDEKQRLLVFLVEGDLSCFGLYITDAEEISKIRRAFFGRGI